MINAWRIAVIKFDVRRSLNHEFYMLTFFAKWLSYTYKAEIPRHASPVCRTSVHQQPVVFAPQQEDDDETKRARRACCDASLTDGSIQLDADDDETSE